MALAETAPYTNNFDGSGNNVDFPNEAVGGTANSSAFVLGSGVYNNPLTATASIGTVLSTASNSFTNLSSAFAGSFTISTLVSVSSFGTPATGGVFTVGFGLFGADTAFSGGAGTAYYLADWAVASGTGGVNATLRIMAVGDTTDTTPVPTSVDANPSSSTQAAVLNTNYTLKLTGTYSGAVLSMSLGVFDAAGTTQIGSSATLVDISPLTGLNFGFRDRFPGTTSSPSTAQVSFDNFAVSSSPVPEPSVCTLTVFSFFLVTLGRRRCSRSQDT